MVATVKEKDCNLCNNMSEKIRHEKNNLLEACSTKDEIDQILNMQGIYKTIEEKCFYLIEYMGATVHASEDDEDFNTLYKVTKGVFLRGNWRDYRGY